MCRPNLGVAIGKIYVCGYSLNRHLNLHLLEDNHSKNVDAFLQKMERRFFFSNFL